MGLKLIDQRSKHPFSAIDKDGKEGDPVVEKTVTDPEGAAITIPEGLDDKRNYSVEVSGRTKKDPNGTALLHGQPSKTRVETLPDIDELDTNGGVFDIFWSSPQGGGGVLDPRGAVYTLTF